MDSVELTNYQGHAQWLSSIPENDPYGPESQASFNTNEWSTGLCSCCVQKNCCNSWCFCFTASMFPYCAYGALLKDAGLVEDCCSASCVSWLFYSIPLLPQVVLCNLRRNIAQARGIRESYLETLLKVLYCFPCAMTQVYNDLVIQNYKFRKNESMFDSFVGNVADKTAFVANPHDPAYDMNHSSINSMYLGAPMQNYGKGTCRCCTANDCGELCCSVCNGLSTCCMMMAVLS